MNPQEQPPTEDRLRLFLANGCVDTVLQLIDRFKLPYRVENGQLRPSLLESEIWLQKFVTEDPETIRMKEDAIRLSHCPDEVLITGATGTGKELIARSMKGARTGMFVAVNCAGFPETLIESELFGYVKGAFTGAEGNREGLMARAKDGVLFLDEIGELPLSVQAKLLRALQDKVIRRVGGRDEERISCKFVCATHRNIKKMVVEEKFRQDLYARISTFELHIKSLSERPADITPILRSIEGGSAFLGELEKLKLPVSRLNVELNVRSLQQYVKRYTVLGRVML